jgi:hypothetical protein
MVSKWWIENDMEVSDRGLILRYTPDIRPEGLRKNMTPPSQDSRSLDRDLNSGPPEYKAGQPLNEILDYATRVMT